MNGTVTGNISTNGADGRNGGNGGNGGNGQNSVDRGGSGLGGAGGTAALNGNGTTNAAGSPGSDAFIDSNGGDGGYGAQGGTGEAGASGAALVLSAVIVNGNVSTAGGRGGNGGNGGRGGNGGLDNGNGGNGGLGGSAGNGGAGRSLTMTNSKILGTLTLASGTTGNGGRGGDGGNADPASVSASAGSGTEGGTRGGTVLASGRFTLTDSGIVGVVTTVPGVCGADGESGVSGTAPASGIVPSVAVTSSGCGGASVDFSSAQTVTDNPPFSSGLNGASTIEIVMGNAFNDPGAAGLDIKDGNLTGVITGDVNTGYPGTYVRTYAVSDTGTTVLLDGVPVTYVNPQLAGTYQRTIIVASNGTQIGGGSSGGGGGGSGGSMTIIYPNGATGTNGIAGTDGIGGSGNATGSAPVIGCVFGYKFNVLTGKPCATSQNFFFGKNLNLFMPRNDDIRQLQVFLNAHGYPVAAGTAPGAPGHETTYFGQATRAALMRLQSATKIKPAIGFFGPITRAYVNGLR